ncbi:MAG: B12-binding domain-containing radical SAM protein [Oscillospiraceae bacterium]|nr:B12-binding domain-containing radical SAM protein [Oscillospiraceae bacterium]
MKVLIYTPPPPSGMMRGGDTLQLPIGPLIIGTYAKNAGHDVKIIDGIVSDSFTSDVSEGFIPDILGVSLLTMYGILDIDGIRSFISDVKKVADPTVVFGGAGASVLSEILLNEKLADYIVHGPGEEVFVELLSALETGSDVSGIPGVAYLDDSGSYVKTAIKKCGGYGLSLPLDYSLMDITRYFHYTLDNKKGLAICTSHGCKYRCTFCYNESFYACSYQTRPVSVIISEMNFLNKNYNIEHFIILDECFGIDKEWMYELCNEIIKKFPSVTWWCQHHGGMKTREDYELMYKAGCREVCIGVESADPQMSIKIRKAIDLTRIPPEIDMMHDIGFSVLGAFILGFPDETFQQLLRTCEFMLSSKMDGFYISKFYLIPETKIYDELVSEGRFKMPKTLKEFQIFLSSKNYTNYSKIPDRELNVVMAFFNLMIKLKFLFSEKNVLNNLYTVLKKRIIGSGKNKQFIFYTFLFHFQMLLCVFAHPFIRKKYKLLFRNYESYTPDKK